MDKFARHAVNALLFEPAIAGGNFVSRYTALPCGYYIPSYVSQFPGKSKWLNARVTLVHSRVSRY